MAGVTTRATKGAPLSATEHDGNLETVINLHKAATAPSPTYACMLWADTATSLIKQRNVADDAWVTLGSVDTVFAFVPIKDEDSMASDSATHLATQQSIKAYVDTVMLTEDTLAELNDTNITSAADGSLLLYDTGTSTWRDAALSGDATISDTGVITIADDAIDSEHYAAGSIDNEHLADDAVGIDELSATGTASGSTFLRGDNAWATPTDTDTVYTHPTYDGDDVDVDTTALTGATVVSDIDINVTTDTSGHVTDANGSVSTRTLTLANLGYTGTTDANTYSHPTSAGNKHIPSGGSSGQFLKYDSSGTAVWAADNDTNTTYSVQDGELSEINFTSADNTKLDSIASSANNYSHPSYNGDDFSIDTGHLSGATVIDDIDINVTTDSSGHVTDANGTVATRNLTLSDLGYSGATNANYITNNNQLSNGAGYVTSSGNTVIGTDSDVDTSGSTIIDNIYMTDGVITSHGTRTLTLGNLGFTGASNANYITNNNQLSNGAGYNNYSFPYSTNANQGFNKVVRWQYGGGGSTSNDDHNVSTFDDHDTGYWSANFSPAMSDDDYACAGSVMSDSQYNVAFFSQSTSKIYFIVRHNTSNAMTDKTTGAIIVGD